MAAHGVPYVASVSLAHPEDTLRKMRHALALEGFRFLLESEEWIISPGSAAPATDLNTTRSSKRLPTLSKVIWFPDDNRRISSGLPSNGSPSAASYSSVEVRNKPAPGISDENEAFSEAITPLVEELPEEQVRALFRQGAE